MGDLQKQLYNKFLEIQDIDPTGLFIEMKGRFFIDCFSWTEYGEIIC